MKELTIYHNPRCSKSRQTLQILRDRGIEPSIVEYLKTPLQKDELKKISTSLGFRPKEFVRKNESDFKEKNLVNHLEDDDKMIEAMAAYPKIIERPIVVLKDKAVIGRPPDNVLKLIKLIIF
jgi:arsenate reductase